MKAWTILLVALTAGALTGRTELSLTKDGKTTYRIVLATNAIASERYAAVELQKYLELISGAKLPILTNAEHAAPFEIMVGDSAQARSLWPRGDVGSLGPDGFAIKSDHGRIAIVGGQPRGTLNGVYALLEEKLGVRWFTPEVEFTPKLADIRLPELNETNRPAVENRDVYWREMMRDADFAAKHRLNGQHYGLTAKHGGPFTSYFPFVHSFDLLVPRALFKEHPEYFPLIHGERKDGYVQRCLTNPDVVTLATETVRRWIQEHPDSTIISISQNDTINNCQCERCKTLDDAEGSPAGSLLQFVNKIAEAMEKDYPNVRIDTLAYQYTRKPPKTIRPHRNVIVRLCSIECCFAHPLDTCTSEENRRFRDDIIAWQPVAPLLYVWDYTPNFAHYLQPFPNFNSLQANVQFFVKHGVKGLFEQGNYSGGGQGEMGPLRAYVLAKLLWDPKTDVAQHVDEFVRGYFGAAAEPVLAYLKLEQQQVEGSNCHAHIYDKPTACYLSADFLQAAERLLDEAERRAESEAVRSRVAVARLPVWYVEIAANWLTGGTRSELIRRFLAVARKAGISDISEGRTLEAWAKQLGAD